LVLEKAMAQAVAGSVLAQDAQSHGGPFNAPADLVLLVNSASESIYAKELDDMFLAVGNRGHIRPDQPLFVSITSETDAAAKSQDHALLGDARARFHHSRARALYSGRLRHDGGALSHYQSAERSAPDAAFGFARIGSVPRATRPGLADTVGVSGKSRAGVARPCAVLK
jgi:hypothetical protein